MSSMSNENTPTGPVQSEPRERTVPVRLARSADAVQAMMLERVLPREGQRLDVSAFNSSI